MAGFTLFRGTWMSLLFSLKGYKYRKYQYIPKLVVLNMIGMMINIYKDKLINNNLYMN